jgi:glycosyltransferase involved in cell wall biosynthesis
MLYLSAIILALVIITTAELHWGLSQIAWLQDIPPLGDCEDHPLVSIVVPARNEQRHIRAALQSLLQLSYPKLEFLLVNDRSQDATGQILHQIALTDSRVRVIDIEALPSGWIGKNHALFEASAQAAGDWLLFTDADVSMQSDTLQQALHYCQQRQLDHLAAMPAMPLLKAIWLQIFVLAFVTLFCSYFKPWLARNRRSSQHLGIGAFNLVRREVYQALGGHQTIRMRPDDDIMLGKLIKKNGFRQDVVNGVGVISVPWYDSLAEAFVGLEKNAFAGVNYRISIVLLGAVFLLLTNVWPFAGLIVTEGWVRAIYAATALLLLGLAWRVASWIAFPRWIALGYPLGIVLILVIQWRAMFLTLKNRGIRWRDTHYALDELKANQI